MTTVSPRLARRTGRAVGVALVAVLLTSTTASAAAILWGPSVKASTGHFSSFMEHTSLMAASDDVYHFLYTHELGVGYRRSVTHLGSMQSEIVLTNDISDAEAIAADGNHVVAVYRRNGGGDPGLFLRRSTSQGAFFFAEQTIDTDASTRYDEGSADVAVSGDLVVVAWTDKRNGAIYLRRSTDTGATFHPKVRLGTTTASDFLGELDGQVAVAVSGAHVYVAWNASHTSHGDPANFVMRRSANSGGSFAALQTLGPGEQYGYEPSIAASGEAMVAAHPRADGSVRVLRSVDGGKTLAGTTVAPAHSSDDSVDVALAGTAVRVVWSKLGKVYLRKSGDLGVNWATKQYTGASTGPIDEVDPNVALEGGDTLLTWNGHDPNPSVGQTVFVKRGTS